MATSMEKPDLVWQFWNKIKSLIKPWHLKGNLMGNVSKKAKLIDIAFLQLSILILSLTGILAKKAAMVRFLSVEFITYYCLELIIIIIYAVMWQQILKRFEMLVAYANKGSIIIWTFIWAGVFFKETITIHNVIGAVFVIIGVSMVFKNA